MSLELTSFSLNTFIGEYPKTLNTNFNNIRDYIGIFYDPSASTAYGFIKVPVNTTGRVKGTTGEFANLVSQGIQVTTSGGGSGNVSIQGNLTVEGNILSANVISSDLDFVTTYNGVSVVPRDASAVWESGAYKYIDVEEPYYKIKNDGNIVALCTDETAQVVQFMFDDSAGTLIDPYYIRLDPSGNVLAVTHANYDKTWVKLISYYAEASTSEARWTVYQYGGTISYV